MDSGNSAEKINEYIKLWLHDKPKLTIGIDGYSGAGKTTILKHLVELNTDILPVFMDDFIKLSAERVKLMAEAKDKSKVFELQWYRYEKLEELVKRFKDNQGGFYEVDIYDYDKNAYGPKKQFDLSRPVLVFEGIFLFHPELIINNLWDKKIYLDTDFKEADDRREKRERERWGDQYVPEVHPDSFLKQYKIAYRRYIEMYNPKQAADLVI